MSGADLAAQGNQAKKANLAHIKSAESMVSFILTMFHVKLVNEFDHFISLLKHRVGMILMLFWRYSLMTAME